jgi:hypothetical protein
MPANDPPRRITITKAPFDFEHSRTSVTHYSATGEFLVPARVADFAVARGFATEGWASDSSTRTAKGGPRRRKRATRAGGSAKPAADARSHARSDDAMGRTGVAAAHRAVAGQPVADSAE